MRKKIIAGNWKMNKNPLEAVDFVSSIKNKINIAEIKLFPAPKNIIKNLCHTVFDCNLLKSPCKHCCHNFYYNGQNKVFFLHHL